MIPTSELLTPKKILEIERIEFILITVINFPFYDSILPLDRYHNHYRGYLHINISRL